MGATKKPLVRSKSNKRLGDVPVPSFKGRTMKLNLDDPPACSVTWRCLPADQPLVQRYGNRLLDSLEGRFKRKPLSRAERRRRERARKKRHEKMFRRSTAKVIATIGGLRLAAGSTAAAHVNHICCRPRPGNDAQVLSPFVQTVSIDMVNKLVAPVVTR